MSTEYWSRYWRARKSRRAVLSGTMSLGVGAAGLGLVGCGSDSTSESNDASILATPTVGTNPTATPTDPFANAKRGGTLNYFFPGDPPTIDPFNSQSAYTKSLAAFVYSRLFRLGTGVGIKTADLKPIPDAAESAEPSPDGMAWTIKLRPGVKFHNVAPVNAREITTDDVKYSWSRLTAKTSPNATQVSFVDKVEYPDASTVKFTLKVPNAAFLDVLADANLLWLMPKEADGGFDSAKTMIGSGPWVFDSYTASVGIKVKKNPAWHVPGFPLMDAVDIAIIPEYPNRIAQYQAGSLDVVDPSADDLVNLKKQNSEAQLFGQVAAQSSMLYFDSDPASPWNKDPRVRLAVSMSLDRDGLTDLAYNIKKLQSQGIDVKSPWNNKIPAGLERFWLDPQSKDQGESAKYFKYDPAGAKQLLSAAGVPDLPLTYQYAGNRYGTAFNAMAEANIQFFNAVGIKTTVDVQDYNSKYITQTAVGNFKGIAFGPETPYPEAGSYVIREFTDDPTAHSKINDPELKALALQQRQELDPAKRKELFYEIQRKNAEKMWFIPHQFGAGTVWTAWQPWMQTVMTLNTTGYGAGTETFPFRWSNK